MTDTIYDDEEIQDTIREILTGCIPERRKELSAFWESFQLRLRLMPEEYDNEKIIFDAGAYRDIRFNFRVLNAFWIGAFAAWEGYRSVFYIFDEHNGCPIGDSFDKLKKYLSSFEREIGGDCGSDIEHSIFIPKLGELPKPNENIEWRAATELATLAIGWAFLHEVRHIQRQQDGSSGQDEETKRNEEFDCDTFATKFMLDKIQEYSESNGEDVEKVRMKRQLGIYVALFTITLLAKDNWGRTASHPAVVDRIKNIKDCIKPTKCEIAEAIIHSSFVSLNNVWETSPLDI